MGVPMILVSIADNQVPVAAAVDAAGLGTILGPVEDVTVAAMQGVLNTFIPDRCAATGQCRNWVDSVWMAWGG